MTGEPLIFPPVAVDIPLDRTGYNKDISSTGGRSGVTVRSVPIREVAVEPELRLVVPGPRTTPEFGALVLGFVEVTRDATGLEEADGVPSRLAGFEDFAR